MKLKKLEAVLFVIVLALVWGLPVTGQMSDDEVSDLIAAARAEIKAEPAVGQVFAKAAPIRVQLDPELDLEEEPQQETAAMNGTLTVNVNCNGNGSINKKLKKKAAVLIIQVHGFCNEDVLIRRDNVTLRGTDPATDGVQAVTLSADDLFSSAVTIREARNVHIENLTLIGGADGLRLENSRRNVTASNLVLTGTRFGAVSLGGWLNMDNITATGSGTAGLATGEAGRMTCRKCVIVDNPSIDSGLGLVASQSAAMAVIDSIVAGSRIPLLVDTGASISIFRTPLTGGSGIGPLVSDYSTLILRESSFDGGLSVSQKASVFVLGSEQIGSPIGNSISRDSHISIGTTQADNGTQVFSTLLGSLSVSQFSTGTIAGGSTIGDLTCNIGSDIFCSAAVVKNSSTCGMCP